MKLLDKLTKELKVNKKGITFLIGIAIIGFIFGSIFITIINDSDKTLVKNYILSYISSIKSDNINYIDNFKDIFLSNFSFIIIVWLLGMSVIGIPINIFYYFITSFTLGFSISSFILTYKIKGILFSIIYVIPHSLINIFIYTYLIYYTINFSLILIYSILKKKSINFKNIINKYIKILICSTLMILFTSTYEAFLIPTIFSKLLFILK